MGLKVFVSVDGDSVGAKVGMARLADDIVELRRIDAAINAGNQVWRSFCESKGGILLEAGGDEACFELPAENLPELSSVAKQYAQVVGATVSVGVGMRLSESSKALLVAKLRGKNQIVLWTEDMQTELEVPPKDEKSKIAEEYLNKAIQADPLSPPLEHSLEDLLHQAAIERKTLDEQQVVQSDSKKEEIRQTLGQILLTIKDKSPIIAQLQAVDPDAYQAILSLVQGVILLGKETLGVQDRPAPAPIAKSDTDDAFWFGSPETAQKFAESVPTNLAKVILDGSIVHVLDASDEDLKRLKELVENHDEIGKSGSAIPGTPPWIRLNTPPGTVINGKVRIMHGDGTMSWIQAGSGLVQATQDPDSPLLGANSHPASARRPGQD